MTTALQIIGSAMGKINVLAAGETVSAEDSALCLDRLNTLIDSLVLETQMAYTTTETVVSLPASTTSLTIGSGQQINVSRPVRIEDSSFSRLDGIDHPLIPVGEAEYNQIALKSQVLMAWPEVCAYDGGSPTGRVQFWPPVASPVELHIVTLAELSEFADLSTEYTLPPGYRRYLENALAVEIAPDFRRPVPPSVVAAAYSAKKSIKRANLVVPQLEMPGSGGYYVPFASGAGPVSNTFNNAQTASATGALAGFNPQGNSWVTVIVTQESGMVSAATVEIRLTDGAVIGTAYYPGGAFLVAVPLGTTELVPYVVLLSGTSPVIRVTTSA